MLEENETAKSHECFFHEELKSNDSEYIHENMCNYEEQYSENVKYSEQDYSLDQHQTLNNRTTKNETNDFNNNDIERQKIDVYNDNQYDERNYADNYQKRENSKRPSRYSVLGKMFIGGLAPMTSEADLKAVFENFGKLIDCVVMRDNLTNRPRGFGFITYENPDNVSKVLKSGNIEIDGRIIDAKAAIPRLEESQYYQEEYPQQSSQKTTKVFVGGLSLSTTEETIQSYFETFGKVEDVELIIDTLSQRSRGFCFVSFEDEEIVEKVASIVMHELDGKQVEVKKALPKNSAQVQINYQRRMERTHRSSDTNYKNSHSRHSNRHSNSYDSYHSRRSSNNRYEDYNDGYRTRTSRNNYPPVRREGTYSNQNSSSTRRYNPSSQTRSNGSYSRSERNYKDEINTRERKKSSNSYYNNYENSSYSNYSNPNYCNNGVPLNISGYNNNYGNSVQNRPSSYSNYANSSGNYNNSYGYSSSSSGQNITPSSTMYNCSHDYGSYYQSDYLLPSGNNQSSNYPINYQQPSIPSSHVNNYNYDN